LILLLTFFTQKSKGYVLPAHELKPRKENDRFFYPRNWAGFPGNCQSAR